MASMLEARAFHERLEPGYVRAPATPNGVCGFFKKNLLDKHLTTGRSLERYYPIQGDQFERAYKEHLSGFSEWSDAEHAQSWLLFPENMGASSVSMKHHFPEESSTR